jgi:dynein heavy chain
MQSPDTSAPSVLPRRYIQRGLFERHKLIFALMLANKILVSAGKVKAADVDVFLKGGAAVDLKKTGQEDRGKWMPEPVQRNIVALSSMDAFRDIQDSVFRNDGLWRQW